MSDTVFIDIAGLNVALHTEDQALAQRLRAQYAGFSIDSAEAPLLNITITTKPGVQFNRPLPGSFLDIDIQVRQSELTFTSYTERGTIDLARNCSHLEIAPNADIENFLRVAYAVLCLKHDALLLHAAGIVRGGLGYVFFGPSGAGKSTIAHLSLLHTTVFSDDLVLVQRHHNGFRLHGVPFRGSFAIGSHRNESAPLRAMFRLQQAHEHSIMPLSPAKALAALAAATPFANAMPQTGLGILNVAALLVAAVPTAALAFRQVDTFWSVIDEYLASQPSTTPADSRARH